jgi:hypothetical protein
MNREQLQDVAGRIEAASGLDIDLAAAALKALQAALPQASSDVRPGVLESADMALHLVVRTLPDWSVVLEGAAREPGHWTCTLRRSSTRDDEEVIGIGRAALPPLALIVALLRVVIARAKGYE